MREGTIVRRRQRKTTRRDRQTRGCLEDATEGDKGWEEDGGEFEEGLEGSREVRREFEEGWESSSERTLTNDEEDALLTGL